MQRNSVGRAPGYIVIERLRNFDKTLDAVTHRCAFGKDNATLQTWCQAIYTVVVVQSGKRYATQQFYVGVLKQTQKTEHNDFIRKKLFFS